MSPAEAVLLYVALSGVLVALGYWLGRRSHPDKAVPRHAQPQASDPQHRRKASQLARPLQEPVDPGERLKREVEVLVQAHRRARAVPAAQTPPAVARVDLSDSEATYAAWFADTTVEPRADSRDR